MELSRLRSWKPPVNLMRIRTIDAHTCGEPLRVIVDGFPEIPGETILARRRYVREHLDNLRTALMWEPRGHGDMYGCIVTPPTSEGADFGVIFMHNEGYSTMCGHGIIGIAMVAVETGLVRHTEPETTIRIDTPAGLVTAYAHLDAGRVRSVRFENVPSFVLALDQIVEVPGLGVVKYDLAFGGAFYAYVDGQALGIQCRPEEIGPIVEKRMAIKRAVMKSRPIVHPSEADLSFLYGTIFQIPSERQGVDSRNVCVFADGEVDRSPTGTGVSGRMALFHAREGLGIGVPKVIESIVGTRFVGRIRRLTTCGPYPAVVPEVEGDAFITGCHEFLIDPDDPLRNGFLLSSVRS